MKRIVLIIVGLVIGINNLFSQWIQTDGPYGNSNIQAAFEHNSEYYASTYLCGFFSRSSTENPWNLNSDIYFKTFTIKGDSLFADAHYFAGGLDRYMGVQLFNLSNPEAPPVSINSIKAKALIHSETCLYGGNETAGFFKLSFDGTALDYYNDGLPTTNVTSIELTNDYIFSGTDIGVFRNSASLASWEGINNGLIVGNVTFIKEIQDTLYTSINGNLYNSNDNGNNWSLIYSTPSKITSFQKDSGKLFVSTLSNGVYISVDYGINWSSINAGLTDLSVNFIVKLDSTVFCGTNTKGLFYYHDGIWSDNNSGMICSYIRSMTVVADNIIANDNESVYKSDTDGDWTDISPIVNYEFFSSVISMNDTIFLSVEYNNPNDSPFILFSSDSGISWESLTNQVPFTGDDPYRIYCDNGKLYAYEDEKMYSTDNLGLSWFDLSLPPQFCNYFYGFVVYDSIPFAIACGEGQLLKLDNGFNWVLSNNGLPLNSEPQGFAYCEDALFIYVPSHGMYVSFDNGDNWSSASNGFDPGQSIRDFAHSGQNLFVSTENGVFITSNYGQNWVSCNVGLKNLNTSSLKLLNDTLYVGTYGNGIWKLAIADIILSASEFESSKSNIRIYPNPASDYLIIECNNDIDFEDFNIVDLMGRQFLSAQFNSKIIDIQDIPNGIYILVLSSIEEMYTTKIIINR